MSSDWISVSDRLPEAFVRVLTIWLDPKHGNSYMVNYLKRPEGGMPWKIPFVTHWMPLPDPHVRSVPPLKST